MRARQLLDTLSESYMDDEYWDPAPPERTLTEVMQAFVETAKKVQAKVQALQNQGDPRLQPNIDEIQSILNDLEKLRKLVPSNPAPAPASP